MEDVHLPARPRFLRPLVETFSQDDLIRRLTPLLYIVESGDHSTIVGHGPNAIDSLCRLLTELPGIVGADTAEEFLIGYRPVSQGSLPEQDDEVLREWHGTLGQLYRLRQTPWLDPGVPGDMGEIAHFRIELLKIFQEDLDALVSPRVSVWTQRHEAAAAQRAR